MEKIRILPIQNAAQAAEELKKIDCDPVGIAIMKEKAVFKTIKIEGMQSRAANLLKQTCLSKGAEAAVSRFSAGQREESTDVIMMATEKQYRRILPVLKQQPWGLARVAANIEQLLQANGLAMRHYRWKDRELILDGKKSLVMGILNLTPDSFSDGGKFNTPETALRQIEQMQKDGADIIDIGAESTRPYNGGQKISAREEMERLLPMLRLLLPHCSVPVSVDTYKAETAEAAIACGIHILNDVWGLQYDQGEMAAVAAAAEIPVIAMHNKAMGEYPEGIWADIHQFFSRTLAIGSEKGIKQENIILDPGIGFAKNLQENLTVLRQLESLQIYDCPLLLAISRKRFIGDVLGLPADDRVEGTISASLLGKMKGVQIHRVHDVKPLKRALEMMDKMMECE